LRPLLPLGRFFLGADRTSHVAKDFPRASVQNSSREERKTLNPIRSSTIRVRPASQFVAALLFAAMVGSSALTRADVPESDRHEVEHLLEFIRQSDCAFIRNGRTYGGERAYRHVQRKYDYFRGDIMDAESFIELSASRSELSGQPYLFACSGTEPRRSRDVLLEELERYRRASSRE
jgi:hypothetical protein